MVKVEVRGGSGEQQWKNRALKNSGHTARDFCKLQGKCFTLFYPVEQSVCSLSGQTQDHIDNNLCAFAEGTRCKVGIK